jgi:hypothetical protein
MKSRILLFRIRRLSFDKVLENYVFDANLRVQLEKEDPALYLDEQQIFIPLNLLRLSLFQDFLIV